MSAHLNRRVHTAVYIVIHESDGKLSINIDLKAAFSSHLDSYDEDGALTAKAFAAN